MKFEVYCDESRQDLFTSKRRTGDRYILIGSLWLPSDMRKRIKQDILLLKQKYSINGEIKWKKVSLAKIEFYYSMIDLFFSYNHDLRFRCIAVENDKMDFKIFHDDDRELGFYKFYYQLLHHWINDLNEYAIYTDLKTNRVANRLGTLKAVLANSNITSEISMVQALPSSESVLIQFSDLLLGIASSKLNNSVTHSSPKGRIIDYLEKKIGRPITHTPKTELKFNVFIISLRGGW